MLSLVRCVQVAIAVNKDVYKEVLGVAEGMEDDKTSWVNFFKEELRHVKLEKAAKKIEYSIDETVTYRKFPSEHCTRIWANNVIERLNREIRRRTRVVGCFPTATQR